MSASVSKKSNAKVRKWFFFLLFKKRTKYLLLYVGRFSPLPSCNWTDSFKMWPHGIFTTSPLLPPYSQSSMLSMQIKFPRLILEVSGHAEGVGFNRKDFFLLNIFPETVSWLFWTIHRECSTVFIGVIKYSLFLAYSAAFDHIAWPFLANGTCSCVPIRSTELWLLVAKKSGLIYMWQKVRGWHVRKLHLLKKDNRIKPQKKLVASKHWFTTFFYIIDMCSQGQEGTFLTYLPKDSSDSAKWCSLTFQEMNILTFFPRVKWEDWYRQTVCSLNMKVQSGDR